jgi:hypothetical protein
MQTQDQHEVYEKARKRTRQKRRLFWHFVVFLVGSVFLIILNEIFKVGEEKYGDWFVWAILAWLFFWILHLGNVYIFDRYFDKDWERRETDKLVAKHNAKVEKLEKKLINEGIISPDSEKKSPTN